MKNWLRNTILAIITIVIFYLIYSRIDLAAFSANFASMDLFLFGLSMLLFIPQFFVVAYRWRLLLSHTVKLGLWDSLKMCLGAGALNSVLPAKLGDAGKALIVRNRFSIPLKRGANSVIFEKMLDFSSLCALFLVGLLVVNDFDALRVSLIILCMLVILATVLYVSFNIRRYRFLLRLLRPILKFKKVKSLVIDTNDYVANFRNDWWLFSKVIFFSLFLWCLHLAQIYLFFIALNASVPIMLVFALVPAAILVGLLPVTIGGMGTRDSALIFLFAPYAPAELMAGVGILTHTRYWIPSLIGLSFLNEFTKRK